MKLVPASLPGVFTIEPQVYRDPRGFFLETYHQQKMQEQGIRAIFVQDNHSRSSQNTLRGLHAQRQHPQGKLIRVLAGEIFDVVVDIRPGSPTYRQWYSETLSSTNYKQLFAPAGYAHGFCVLSEYAEVEYKVTDFYDPTDEIHLLWNDPALGIRWPVQNPVLSDKDRRASLLKDLEPSLPRYQDSLSIK
jgi:dTDP-4-dehydrorhamnose 3,5-epimerase